MVIPLHARSIGVTVRTMYISITMASLILVASVALSPRAHALLPVSDIPIVGQPVADTLNTVTDDVLLPTVDTVTEILPEPVAQVVEAPVEAATQAVAPIVGPSSSPNTLPRQIVSLILPQQSETTAPAPTPGASAPAADSTTKTKAPVIQQASTQQPPTDEGTVKMSLPLMSTYFSSLIGNYIPVLEDSYRTFIGSSRDISRFISSALILVIMAILLVRFVLIIAKRKNHSGSADEIALARHDLTQESVIALFIMVFGLISIMILLAGNSL